MPTIKKLAILLTAMFSIMLTACVIAQDSIKFSVQETKVLLMHHVNYMKLQKIVDSSQIQEQKFNKIIHNDSLLLADCNSLLTTKDQTVSKTENEVKLLQKDTKHNSYWKVFWRRCAAVLSITSLTEAGIIYLNISK